MKRVLVVVAVAAVVTYAAGAWSAAPPTPTEKKLLRDVRALQAQVKTLQVDEKKLKSQVTAAATLALGIGVINVCATAIAADALQGTWQVLDQLSAATQAGKTYFGPQTPVDDTIAGQSVCQTIGVARSQAVPPSAATFTALLALFKQPAS